MRTPFILICIIALFALGSCKHYCQTSPYPTLRFENFDSVELNTVIVSTYPPDGKFAEQLSRHAYTSKRTDEIDTIALDHVDSSAMEMFLGFMTDAIIEIPAVGRTYRVKGVAVHRDTWNDVNCTNSMSYYVNDTPGIIPMQPTRDYPGKIKLIK